ncbi:MAG: Trehalose/maltose import ATP-binding protein MalK [Candidatus Woesearchaeota archaeon]|nr:Trehalose/maltose import ATP-binding protein MalK [Candidatus Woesearchaeota archaeon]
MVVKPLIRFQNVSKRFGNKHILHNISFNVYKSEIFGLIGSSGAGKTTLLRALIGFYKLNGGDIIFKNKSISHKLKEIRKVVGFATQDNCIYDELTAFENIVYYGRLHGLPTKALKTRANYLLHLVELSAAKDEYADNLSGGMKRRLDLACAMVHDPPVLIMDEPTAGLDPLLRKHMWHLIESINRKGTTIIISSHLLEEIEHICTRVAIISKGKLLVVGSPNQLKDMYSRNEEIHLECYPGRYNYIVKWLKSQRLPITYHMNRGHKLVIYTPKAETVLHYTLHLLEQMQERLLDVEVNKPSLNEVFEAFTRNDR